MILRTLARLATVALVAGNAGACTLVGYPAGAPGPAAPVSGAPAPSAAPAAANPGVRPSDAGRTYEVFGREYRVLDSAEGYVEEGMASWYGDEFHGRPTASGERYDMHRLSAAHRTLPLHTWVEVTNLQNGRSVVLKVNDRGPFARTGERILDLSYAAARELGVVAAGTARVRVRALTPDEVGTPR